MKAISLWQPWATLIVMGAKRVETRSWKPPEALIGKRIAIHASKRLDPLVLQPPFSDLISDPVKECPTGMLLGTCTLEGAFSIDHEADALMIASEYHRTDNGHGYTKPTFDEDAVALELAFGDYTVGRWAWGLADVRPLVHPVPFNGRQKFWDIGLPEGLTLA